MWSHCGIRGSTPTRLGQKMEDEVVLPLRRARPASPALSVDPNIFSQEEPPVNPVVREEDADEESTVPDSEDDSEHDDDEVFTFPNSEFGDETETDEDDKPPSKRRRTSESDLLDFEPIPHPPSGRMTAVNLVLGSRRCSSPVIRLLPPVIDLTGDSDEE